MTRTRSEMVGALLEVALARMEVTGRTRPGFVRPRAMMRWARARKQRARNGSRENQPRIRVRHRGEQGQRQKGQWEQCLPHVLHCGRRSVATSGIGEERARC